MTDDFRSYVDQEHDKIRAGILAANSATEKGSAEPEPGVDLGSLRADLAESAARLNPELAQERDEAIEELNRRDLFGYAIGEIYSNDPWQAAAAVDMVADDPELRAAALETWTAIDPHAAAAWTLEQSAYKEAELAETIEEYRQDAEELAARRDEELAEAAREFARRHPDALGRDMLRRVQAFAAQVPFNETIPVRNQLEAHYELAAEHKRVEEENALRQSILSHDNHYRLDARPTPTVPSGVPNYDKILEEQTTVGDLHASLTSRSPTSRAFDDLHASRRRAAAEKEGSQLAEQRQRLVSEYLRRRPSLHAWNDPGQRPAWFKKYS